MNNSEMEQLDQSSEPFVEVKTENMTNFVFTITKAYGSLLGDDDGSNRFFFFRG